MSEAGRAPGTVDPKDPRNTRDSAVTLPAVRDLVAAVPLFAGIPLSALEPFLRRCEIRRLACRDVVLSPGEPNHFLYVLLSGRLAIHFESLESEAGILVPPGEFVGEVSIIDNLAPTAYVAASEESLILGIPEEVLWSHFFQVPGAARNLLGQIAARMRARNLMVQKSLEQALRLEHLEKELRIAHDIQAGMQPRQPFFPGHPQVDVDALMEPAKEIGGDFVDAFPVDSRRICVAIGDVAGKGIPAALFMVRTITLLRAEMAKSKDLLQTIGAMNATLSQDNGTFMFVTLMICILDVATGELLYVNGGHNRPLLGNAAKGYEYVAQPPGILVGVEPRAEFQVARRILGSGDTLILFTDGVTEANNPLYEEFSEARLLDWANRRAAGTANDLVAGIRLAVQDFAAGAEQSDDLTVLVLRYLGP